MSILRIFLWFWLMLLGYATLKIPGLIGSFTVFMVWLFIKDRFFFWVFFLSIVPPVIFGILFKPIGIAYYVITPVIAFIYGKKWLEKEKKIDKDAPDDGGRFYIYGPVNAVVYTLGFIVIYILSVLMFAVLINYLVV